ncbi:MAG: hypothetical protein ACI4MF_13830 [Candidatus Faecivicinus sp.]
MKAKFIPMCSILCAIIMLALLVLQFVPFWHYGEAGEESASMNGYIWFPMDYGDLESYFAETTGKPFDVNSILAMPILHLVLGAAGIVLCVLKRDQVWVSLFPVAVGGVGVWGFLSKPVYRLGSTWQLQLALCVVMLAIGLISLVLQLSKKD